MKNMGTSALLALAVTIEFTSKSYMMFEISYLHYTSYSIFELIIITIQFTCFALLFISYVCTPNLPYLNEEDEFNQKSNDEKKLLNTNIHQQKGFSIKSRSLLSNIFFFYYESFAFFGFRNTYNLDNILPLEHELKVFFEKQILTKKAFLKY